MGTILLKNITLNGSQSDIVVSDGLISTISKAGEATAAASGATPAETTKKKN